MNIAQLEQVDNSLLFKIIDQDFNPNIEQTLIIVNGEYYNRVAVCLCPALESPHIYLRGRYSDRHNDLVACNFNSKETASVAYNEAKQLLERVGFEIRPIRETSDHQFVQLI